MRQLQNRSRTGISAALVIAIMAILSTLMLSTVSAQTETTTEQLDLTATAVILFATNEALGTPITTPFPPAPNAQSTLLGDIDPMMLTATAVVQGATQTAIATGITTEMSAQADAASTDNTASMLVLVLIVGIVMAVIGFVVGQRTGSTKRKNS
ncbi:hypothetical protein FBR02_13930 [Anaerolineae bacterium CFX9]|nr:hypothetical protein [Anaerolineae bacterium CFX9]